MAIRFSRLRRYRKHAHLSQRELAYLVGVVAQGMVSEIETGLKHPSIGVEACCEVVFDNPLKELYPTLYTKAENEVFERAVVLLGQLRADPARADAAQYVAALISRLDGAHSTTL